MGTVQRIVQIRGLSCEDVDLLGDVAVGRGAGDAVIAAELGDVALAPEPAQDQHRLPERGQSAAALGSTHPPSFVLQ
ncbi:hypothetical protein AB0L53_46465 [Nonomuraea sp. NPDC052129]|uniref:hypothetical protein n=1 Tax=Nonomuraea sp. NPDC052129 TaxID=3154651 RepID=UPI003419E088